MEASAQRPATLLVVDDNVVVLTATAGLLRGAGYQVLEAGTCADGLRVLGEYEADLVLLDVVLPDGSGVDLCRRIKSLPGKEHTFVVLLSSREVSSDRQASGLDAGADGYVARPIENRELVSRVHALVRIQQAEAALRRSQLELEQRVERRTTELAAANAALQAEIDERVRAELALRDSAERLRIQHGIGHAILAAHSPAEIAEAALVRSRRLLGWSQACVLEIRPEQNRAAALCAYRGGEKISGGEWQLSREQWEHLGTLQNGRPRALTECRCLFPFGEGTQTADVTWATILDVPLVAEGNLMGVFKLLSDHPSAFSPVRMELASEIASQLAVALKQARLFEEVSLSRERLRALSLRLVQVQESERRFIARELHDEFGQILTSLKLSLDLMKAKVGSHLQSDVDAAVGCLGDLMARVRKLSLELRPQMLDDLGLLPALTWHFKRFTAQTGIVVDFKQRAMDGRLPEPLETAAYRLIQEALTNVARYAGVKQAAVRVWTDDDHLRVQVEDEGTGFEPDKIRDASASNGISGMRERVELLGGEFVLESAPGRGTRVTGELPLCIGPSKGGV